MTDTWCVGGKHYGNTLNQKVYVKVTTKLEN